jgi:hypothetical protein
LNLYAYVGGDPVNYIDPWGLKPGDKFATADAAAIDAVQYVFSKFVKPDGQVLIEYGGWIYLENGQYSYTLVPGLPTQVPVKTLLNDKKNLLDNKKCLIVASWHTHPRRYVLDILHAPGGEKFSGSAEEGEKYEGDLAWAWGTKLPFYLGTPTERVWVATFPYGTRKPKITEVTK